MAFSFEDLKKLIKKPDTKKMNELSARNVFQIINSYSESFRAQQTPTMLVGGGFSTLQWILMGFVAIFTSVTIWQFADQDRGYSVISGFITIFFVFLFIISIVLELLVGFHKEAKEQISRVMKKSEEQFTTDLSIIDKLKSLPKDELIFAKKTYNRIYFDYKSQYNALTVKGFFGLVTVGSINHFYGLEEKIPFLKTIWPIVIIIFGSMLIFSLISSVMSFSLRLKGGQYQRIIDILDQSLAAQTEIPPA
ncbi:hypothetical protein MKW11_11605 [Gluconobacter frateurii]|uniref:hypothetical protein n=1 Tax=Gluconobacter frateurii TaxID=38308 RepID=UPI001F05EF11|nr:hypothetical protein [Gluconobacter frateurii]UMM07857.1 hypothetical protein MKW11_11605 [Gluconobacter frateurii]